MRRIEVQTLVFKNILPLIQPLLREDENRRYIVQDDVLIKTKDDATISAIVARQRGVTTPRPTALVFTIRQPVVTENFLRRPV